VSGKITITGNVSDEDGNITHVIVTILGTTTYHDNVTINGQGIWTYEWNTEEWVDDVYWITAQCFDGDDYSEQAHLNVTVDNDGSGEDGDDEDDEDEGFFSGSGLVVVLVLVIAVVAIAAYFIMEKKEEDEEDKEDEEEVKEEEAEEG